MSQMFYGDHNRWFVGLVIDVNDPLKLDRVKVRIQGIHTHDTTLIPNADLPWAQVIIPVTEGGSSGIGANCSIKPRAQVFGFFLDGKNSQLPLVVGSIPKIESYANQSGDADNTFPSFNKKSGEGNIDLNLDGNSNIEKAFNFFVSEEGGNYSMEQACGIIGNFCQESGPTLNPRAVAANEGSTGIAQWNPAAAAGNRLGQLVEYSNTLGLNHLTLGAQLLFTKYELETFSYLGDGLLRKASTTRDATIVFQNSYERPLQALAHTEDRVNFAKEIFNKLVNV
tara:strand:- start:14822 stop:15667 length:846 start_codon:yes stop_codon:yes gene_type:complete